MSDAFDSFSEQACSEIGGDLPDPGLGRQLVFRTVDDRGGSTCHTPVRSSEVGDRWCQNEHSGELLGNGILFGEEREGDHSAEGVSDEE